MAGIATHASDTDLLTIAINFAGAGDNTVILGVTNAKISIVKIAFTVHAATNIILKDGTTALSGAMEFGALGGMVLEDDRVTFVISKGNAFIMNNSNAVQVSGFVTYSQRLGNQG